MSRRKTVKLNLEVVLPLIKEKCRSNVVFCEKMGRPTQKTWVTDWNRKDENGNPKPKNLPSPEEAARMCVLLQTTPEEILVEQADIDLVNALLESEMEKEKTPTGTGERESISPAKQALLDAIDGLSDEQCEKLLIVVESAKKLL